MRLRVPILVSFASLVTVTLLSAWAWIEVPGSKVLAGVGSDLELVSKLQGLVVGPLLFVGLPIVLFLAIPRIEPRRHHLVASSKAYTAIWIVLVLAGVLVHLSFVLRATDRNFGLSENLVELVAAFILIVSGNYMSKIRSNFFIGIRTPWTLSSEESWRKTHRLGGRILVLLGFALIPLSFVTDATTNLWMATALIIATAVLLIAYSYVAWRSDTTAS